MDLLKDLSTLTTIPVTALNKLVNKSNYCISYGVQESLNRGENVTQVDIGVGMLNIIVDNDNIYYKFIPSKKLENSVKETVITGKNPLVESIEETIKDKIINVYKELF